MAAMRVRELPHQPRLADTWLTHDRDHLAMALARLSEGLPQQLHLGFAAHEARQPSGGRHVQSTTHVIRADELKDLDRCRQTLHGRRAARHHLYEAFRKSHRVRRQQNGSGPSHLFHPRG
jgi:hypothetical protein